MQSTHVVYRNAVYLNNAAASLQNRGDIGASIKVLKGALTRMACVVSGSDNEWTRLQNQAMQDEVKETEQRLACPQKPQDDSHDLTIPSPTHLVVCNFDGLLDPNICIETSDVASSGVFLCIDTTSLDESTEYVWQLVPTILLSNFAMSYLSMAPWHPDCRDQALHLLHTASSILGVHCKDITELCDGGMHMAIVIWHNICCTLASAPSRRDEWVHARQTLASLQLVLYQWSKLTGTFVKPAAAA